MAEWNCFTCKKQNNDAVCFRCKDGSEYIKQTNADRIRSMTDEELAEFLDNMCLVKTDFHCEECNNPLNCDVCYLEWLQSEAE